MKDESKIMTKTIFCDLPRDDDKTHPSVMNGSQTDIQTCDLLNMTHYYIKTDTYCVC
jgi:hypothetical protein